MYTCIYVQAFWGALLRAELFVAELAAIENDFSNTDQGE